MNKLLIHKIGTKIENDMKTEGRYGATFRVKRREMMKTLKEISQRYGISISYLSKLENDVLKPNIETLSKYFTDFVIDEDMILSSAVMDDWYLTLIEYIMGINDSRETLRNYLTRRDDFQSKLIEFAIDVKEQKIDSEAKSISLILHSIDTIQPLELTIFILSLVRLYIDNNEYFLAGRLLKELNINNLFYKSIRYWFLDLKYELALYQSSFNQVESAYERLCQYHIYYGKYDAIKQTRTKFIEALAYMLEPKQFDPYLKDKGYVDSYRISLILHEEYNTFNTLEPCEDVASLLYYDLINDVAMIRSILPKVLFKNGPFENMLKNYFLNKYNQNNVFNYLRETLFSNVGLAQHYYSSHFIQAKLSNILMDQSKYKQSHLVSLRLFELNKLNRTSLASKELL